MRFQIMVAGMNGAGNLVDDNADLILDINDQNNITYILPTMGGLTIGASYEVVKVQLRMMIFQQWVQNIHLQVVP